MDAYEFFTKKHEKDIDYSNIYTLGRIYNLLGKYFPSAIKYLNRIMEKYPNDECMQDYMKKLKYKIQVEYKYQVYTRQMMNIICYLRKSLLRKRSVLMIRSKVYLN